MKKFILHDSVYIDVENRQVLGDSRLGNLPKLLTCPVVKNAPANARDMGSIAGPGRFHVLRGN